MRSPRLFSPARGVPVRPRFRRGETPACASFEESRAEDGSPFGDLVGAQCGASGRDSRVSGNAPKRPWPGRWGRVFSPVSEGGRWSPDAASMPFGTCAARQTRPMDRDRAVGAADAVLRSRNGEGPLCVPIHPGGNAWKKCPTHAGHCSMFRGVPENGSGWRECDVVRGALAFPVSTPFFNICRISLFRSCPKPVGRT